MNHRWTCHTCGVDIPYAEFEKRRAVIVMKRHFCGRCSDRIAATGERGGRTTLALAGFRDRPRLLAAAAMITLALGALLYVVFVHRPPF